MDINYKDFKDFFEFPLAEYYRDQAVDCLIFPTAWTHAGEEEEKTDKTSLEIAFDVFEWWSLRLTPMIGPRLRLRREVKPRLEKE